MGVNYINFLNLKTQLRISSIEAAVRRKTLRYFSILDCELLILFNYKLIDFK